MPRIPEFEDLGNEAQVVSDDDFFGALASHYVSRMAAVRVSVTPGFATDDLEIAIIPGAHAALRTGAEVGTEVARSSMIFHVHSAMHRRWVESFAKDENGEYSREPMMRSYVVLMQNENKVTEEGNYA